MHGDVPVRGGQGQFVPVRSVTGSQHNAVGNGSSALRSGIAFRRSVLPEVLALLNQGKHKGDQQHAKEGDR